MAPVKSLLAASATATWAAASATPAWKVIDNSFSAVSIGIGFHDDKIGWTSHTDGASAVKLVRTDDGGSTWTAVNSSGIEVMTMGVAATPGTEQRAATTGLLGSSSFTVDGFHFKQSLGGPLVSQDIKYQADRVITAEANGVCISTTGGMLYSCVKVPLKHAGTGRYASSPSKDVIYFTAGQWPSKGNSSDSADGKHVTPITRNVRLLQGAGSVSVEVGEEKAKHPAQNATYTAELWKSTDGGKTWKNLISDEGNFYFNDISCFDETHCVAVGEGFAQDGSKSPGARVYVTTDGETFKVAHQEATTGKESLMAAHMISNDEHWVGGTTVVGGFSAPALMLHSKDGGKSWTNENNKVVGQMITSFGFVSDKHAYATAINALQVCSILEYGGSTPPAPTPSPSGPHYEKPPCQAGEAEASVTGSSGKLCAPPCTSGQCPQDPPKDVKAAPACILQDQSGNHFCALECAKNSECDVAGGSSCSILQGGKGVCTYPAATFGAGFMAGLELFTSTSELVV